MGETSAAGPLRRPPIRTSVVVEAGQQQTFDVFVESMAQWWPTEIVSAGRDKVCQIVIEPRPGGRVDEIWDDGTRVCWGEVQVWEPPHHFVMSWASTPQPTEVEFTFAPLGPALTRVTVEHRGWEQLTETELAAPCAGEGGYRGGSYSRGWELILHRLTSHVDTIKTS